MWVLYYYVLTMYYSYNVQRIYAPFTKYVTRLLQKYFAKYVTLQEAADKCEDILTEIHLAPWVSYGKPMESHDIMRIVVCLS